MSRKLTKLTIIAVVAVSLSGCAQINKLGDNMWGHTKNAWGYTKSAANFVASPVTKLLRSAPEPKYVFEDATREQNMAKQAFNSDGHSAYSKSFDAAAFAQLPVPQTPTYQAPASSTVPVAPRRVVQAQQTAPLNAPRISNDISFVKIGGGSNMQDWVMCEAEAGGFVRVVEGGYLIDPGFERCMRTKGYVPESEVADVIGTDRAL